MSTGNPAEPAESSGSSTPPAQQLSHAQRLALIALLRRHGVQRAGLFGSVARGVARPDSDVDLLIQPPQTMTLFGFSALALALEDLLGRPVDLVTYGALSPRLRDSVYAHYDPLFTDDMNEVSAEAAP